MAYINTYTYYFLELLSRLSPCGLGRGRYVLRRLIRIVSIKEGTVKTSHHRQSTTISNAEANNLWRRRRNTHPKSGNILNGIT